MKCSHLDNLWFVTGADGEDLEQATASPEQFLVGVEPHDAHQQGRPTTGKDNQLQI